MQDRLPTHPTTKACFSWGCLRGGFEGEAKLCVTPVVHQALPLEVLMHVSGQVQPPSLQLKITQVIQLFVKVVAYPFAYRLRRRWITINRRSGGIESSCLRGIRDDNSFGDLRFSGPGELSCPL